MTKQGDQTDIAVVKSQLSDIKDDIRDIKLKLENDYVTQQEFEPVKKLVYGLVALTLTAVVGGLLALVVKK